MMRSRAVMAVLAAALIATSCNGGDEAASTTTPAPPSAPTTAATTAAPSTAPTTTQPTTAAPTTSPPTTTPTTPPPSVSPTTLPPQDLRAEIEADLNEGEQAYIAAAADPSAPESRAVLERYFTGTSLEAVRSIFDQLVEGGLVVRPNPAVPNVIVVQSKPQPLDADGMTYSVDLCRVDAAVVYTPPSSPGGPEIIFNDVVFRELTRTTVVMSDGIWIPSGGVELAPDAQEATCG